MVAKEMTERAAEAREGKYLTFQLAAEIYGIAILKVQEIIGMMPVTRVPRTPDCMRGVINLRGKVIPVVDLRRKFGMESAAVTGRTCIVVVQVRLGDGSGRAATLGLLVDEVSEVLNVAADQVVAPPDFAAGVRTDFLLGMGKVGQKVVMLLDVERVLGVEEMMETMETTGSPMQGGERI